MIADRAKAMMAAGGDFPELEARGAYSGEWQSLPERRITFHFYTERDDEFLDFGSFCMKCGGRPLVEGALDFYPWHLLGVAAFSIPWIKRAVRSSYFMIPAAGAMWSIWSRWRARGRWC